MAQKNIREPFFLKIKCLKKQKCVYILFLINSKILKRFNHRITENLQTCNKKIFNFQFGFIFYGKVVFQVSTEHRIFITLEFTKKKETRGFEGLFLKN